MAGHCKDCKYSKEDTYYTDRWNIAKQPHVAGDGPPLLVCTSERWKQGYGISTIADGEVLVENDEEWGFRVSPLFGCIHFEAK